MKPGRGKSKGNRFENLVARTLSRWLKPGDATQLVPSRLSGGWKDAQWRHAGDLAPNGPEGEEFRRLFLIECKHQNKDLLWMLYTSTPKQQNIQGWWQKLHTEAKELGNIPMLVFRQNTRPILVVLPRWLARQIHKAVGGVMLEYSSRYIEEIPISCGIIPLQTLTALLPAKLYDLLPPKEK
ncbi:hypothetical protein LCGC14_2712320 [marine sediment metagenome]|uniref:Uncharacterized protein n=1 Tax=marine sediment metagenome TaxID=412755 RepID=A0A0F9C4C4_9ZZZZ